MDILQQQQYSYIAVSTPLLDMPGAGAIFICGLN
jgi:hypothetical protein